MKIKYLKDVNEQSRIFLINIEQDGNFYNFSCVNEKDKEMGYATCSLKEDSLWLNKIETFEEFAHQGVASAIIDIVEYIAMTKKRQNVEGKYYPLNEFAEPFYEKHGYFIPNKTKDWDTYDETWRMYKVLDFKKIDQVITKNMEILEECEDENV